MQFQHSVVNIEGSGIEQSDEGTNIAAAIFVSVNDHVGYPLD